MPEFSHEEDAARGAPLPDGLDMVDACCYMALRGLYAMFQLGMISRGEAAAEKQRLKKLRDDTRRQQRFERDLAQMRWDLIKATEAARSRFRLEPTVEHGFDLCAAIDGAKRRREATA